MISKCVIKGMAIVKEMNLHCESIIVHIASDARAEHFKRALLFRAVLGTLFRLFLLYIRSPQNLDLLWNRHHISF